MPDWKHLSEIAIPENFAHVHGLFKEWVHLTPRADCDFSYNRHYYLSICFGNIGNNLIHWPDSQRPHTAAAAALLDWTETLSPHHVTHPPAVSFDPYFTRVIFIRYIAVNKWSFSSPSDVPASAWFIFRCRQLAGSD